MSHWIYCSIQFIDTKSFSGFISILNPHFLLFIFLRTLFCSSYVLLPWLASIVFDILLKNVIPCLYVITLMLLWLADCEKIYGSLEIELIIDILFMIIACIAHLKMFSYVLRKSFLPDERDFLLCSICLVANYSSPDTRTLNSK